MLGLWLLPVRFGGVLVSWVPWLGDNITAPPNLVDRLTGDIDASRELLEGVIELRTAYAMSLTAMNDISLPRHDGAVQARLSKASEHLGRANVALQSAETISSTSDPDRYIHILKTYNDSLSLKEIEIRSFIDWASSASETVRHLYDSLTALSSLLKYFEERKISSQAHLELLLETLDLVTFHGSAAFDSASRTNLITPENLLGSDIANYLHIVEVATNGLSEAAAGTSLGLRAVTPALKIFETGSAGLLSGGERNLKVIDVLALNRGQFDLAIPLLESGSAHIDEALELDINPLDSSLISKISDTVSLLHSGFRFARDFPILADDLLGANGPRTYLVLGQTSDELRATGGFVSALWLLTADRGSLISAEYHDIVEVDNLVGHLILDEPVEVDRHLGRQTLELLPGADTAKAAELRLGADEAYLYVSERNTSQLFTYRLDASGALQPLGPVKAPDCPTAFTLTAGGHHLIALGEQSGEAWTYRIGPDGRPEHINSARIGAVPSWAVAL